MRIRPKHNPPVQPVSMSFGPHANDEEQRRRLPPRWPHVSGEKPPKALKKAQSPKQGTADDGVEAVPTIIYQKTAKGEVVLKTIPEDDGHSLDCRA